MPARLILETNPGTTLLVAPGTAMKTGVCISYRRYRRVLVESIVS